MATSPSGPAGEAPYERDEGSWAELYKPSRPFYDTTPADIAAIAEALHARTRLPRHADEYPDDVVALHDAAVALEVVAKEACNFTLDFLEKDGTQLDRFIDVHVVDERVRKFLAMDKDGAVSKDDVQEFAAALDAMRVPNEPLLLYALGAWWGEWLIKFRRCIWGIYPPLRPVQVFPDMITGSHTVCIHPFSQVNKKLGSPEADNLSFKGVLSARSMGVAPYPLIATPADSDYATAQLLPAEARRAIALQKDGDHKGALRLFAKAAAEEPDNVRILSLAAPSAFETRDYAHAEALLTEVLAKEPELPVLNHNLAILYTWSKRMPQARALLERAVKSDPNYSRARLTLAMVCRDLNDVPAARAQMEWVREHDAQLKADAEKLLGDLDK